MQIKRWARNTNVDCISWEHLRRMNESKSILIILRVAVRDHNYYYLLFPCSARGANVTNMRSVDWLSVCKRLMASIDELEVIQRVYRVDRMEETISGNSHISPLASNKEKKAKRERRWRRRPPEKFMAFLWDGGEIRKRPSTNTKRLEFFADSFIARASHSLPPPPPLINNNQFSITECQFIARINRALFIWRRRASGECRCRFAN